MENAGKYPRVSGLGEERVWKPSPLRRVDIVAMGVSSLDYVRKAYHQPGFRKPDHQVWIVNSGAFVFQHDLVWNMHDLERLKLVPGEVDFVTHYKELQSPLVTIRALESLPTSLEFPLAEAVEQFGQTYFANTVAYMVCAAIMCGVKEIGIYGADYQGMKYRDGGDKSDYEAGRACVEYWIGIANSKGILVFPGENSSLLDACWRGAGGKGCIGYGSTYGYFERQPVYSLDAEGFPVVVDFNKVELTEPVEN